MRRGILLATILLCLSQLVGCTQPTHVVHPAKRNNPDVLKLAWQFRIYDKTDSLGISYPFSDISIVVYGEQEQSYQIGTYKGNAQIIYELGNRDLPVNTITACQAYYAGGGEDICIVRSANTLNVMWRSFDEPSIETPDLKMPKFRTIKTIKVPDNTIIIELTPN